MERTITIKGTGNVSMKPDLIRLAIVLETTDMDYQVTMDTANEQIESLRAAFALIGFKKEELKTTDFNVRQNTEYDHEKRIHVFNGYTCKHSLRLEFDFDVEVLGRTISAMSGSGANPKFTISFTIKDEEKTKEDLLVDAVSDAMKKADILASAAKVSLGQLLAINHSWGELHLFSKTAYDYCEPCDHLRMVQEASLNIEPDNVIVQDTVTLAWEIT